MEIYFTWFSALIFSGELIVGKKTMEHKPSTCCCLCLRSIQKLTSVRMRCKVHSNILRFNFTDFSVATYYFTTNQMSWGIYTLLIIIVPLILCQIYSLWLLKSENNQFKASAICLHLVLCGILYRCVKVEFSRNIDVDILIFQTS